MRYVLCFIVLLLGQPAVADSSLSKVLVIGIDTSSSTSVSTDRKFKQQFLHAFETSRVASLVEQCFDFVSFVPWSSGTAHETASIDLHAEPFATFTNTVRLRWPTRQTGGSKTEPGQPLATGLRMYPQSQLLILIYLDRSHFLIEQTLRESRKQITATQGAVFVAMDQGGIELDISSITDEHLIDTSSDERHVRDVYSMLLEICELPFM